MNYPTHDADGENVGSEGGGEQEMFFKTQKEMLGACVCGPRVIELASILEHIIWAT